MQLGAFFALGPIIAAPGAAFRRGSQRAAVHNDRAGLLGTTQGCAQHGTQIVDEHVKAAGCQPALRLLVDRRPRRQVMGHLTPLRTGFDDIAQAVEDLAQRMLALASIFRQQGQIPCHQGPFFIRDV